MSRWWGRFADWLEIRGAGPCKHCHIRPVLRCHARCWWYVRCPRCGGNGPSGEERRLAVIAWNAAMGHPS